MDRRQVVLPEVRIGEEVDDHGRDAGHAGDAVALDQLCGGIAVPARHQHRGRAELDRDVHVRLHAGEVEHRQHAQHHALARGRRPEAGRRCWSRGCSNASACSPSAGRSCRRYRAVPQDRRGRPGAAPGTRPAGNARPPTVATPLRAGSRRGALHHVRHLQVGARAHVVASSTRARNARSGPLPRCGSTSRYSSCPAIATRASESRDVMRELFALVHRVDRARPPRRRAGSRSSR